jgi:hypothetical protein
MSILSGFLVQPCPCHVPDNSVPYTVQERHGGSFRIAYRRTTISSFPRAVLVMSVIGLAFLPHCSVSMVITLQMLLLPPKATHPEWLPH